MKSMPRAALAIPVLVLVPLLAACGGGGSGGGSGSSAASDSAGGSSARAESLVGAPEAPAQAPAKNAAAVSPMSRAVVSTGQITLHSRSLDRTRADVFRLVTSWAGSVADEQSTSDRRGRIVDSTLTLRVPTESFSKAMDALARVGEVDDQSRTSEDVTTKVLDNDARVRAAERSIRQIEVLLDRAEKLSDIIAIESDLARRQADLDSLKSQQAWLADQTSLSTITVSLSRTPHVAPGEHEARGFLAGLDHGWDALKGGTLLVLTAVGAVLPFAVLVLLLGVPVWVVVRRRASAASAPARSA
jgi:hypothetical protein